MFNSHKTQLILVGTNHKHSPLEMRERLGCQQESLPKRLQSTLQGNKAIKEVVILSTCNRTEIYAVSTLASDVSTYLAKSMSDWANVQFTDLKEHLYTLTDEKAAWHLIAVASGLDSLVPGEQQIRGQVKEAAKAAVHSGTIGQFLSEIFSYAYRAGKEVRGQSSFGLNGGSVGSAVISLLKKISSTDHISSILLIGAGKVISLAADDLSSIPGIEVWVTNRTAQRARDLAERLGGKAVPFDQVAATIERVDAVLTCVSAADHVITTEALEAAMLRRTSKRLVLLDAAVPRNIEPSASKIRGIELHNIDDLAPFLMADPSYRKNISNAEALVDTQTERLWSRIRANEATETLRELRKAAEKIRKSELSRALRKLGDLSERDRKIVDLLSKRIVNKLLYQPTEKLKEHASNGDGELFEQVLRELFAIEQEHKP